MFRTFLLASLLCAFAALASAGEQPADATQNEPQQNRWLIQTSLYTNHFGTDEPKTKHQKLIGIERWSPDNWIIGASAFRNSFDQASQYVYVGKLWRPLENYPIVHLKLTGGILHGYKPPHEDKIPLNTENGWAIAVLPSIGLSGKRFVTDLVIFGTAGALVTIGVLVP